MSDVISIHLPLTENTKNLLNYNTIKKMVKHPIIINSSRGSIVNEEDLLRAYEEKLISGFALDVYNTEPAPKSFLEKIKKNTNCILSPHVAGVTEESNKRVSEFIANTVKNFSIYKLNSFINTTLFSLIEFSAASPIATDINPSLKDTSGFSFF